MTPTPASYITALCVAALTLLATPAAAGDLEAALEAAGENRMALEAAIAGTPEGEREGMRWLVAHMPTTDLKSLTTEFLMENNSLAYESWRGAPWQSSVDKSLFFDAILPFASVNERRDPWRKRLRTRCLPLVGEARSASEAATLLNNAIWKEFGVKYSTARAKPDQSPFETIDSGLASCTGLSVLLIDSCRAVGVPARFVGTPRWSDDSGNHSWVEVWDDGWHFTGAAEPTGSDLDRGWFAGRAAGATRDDPDHAIFAVTWRDTPISFPLVWLPEDRSVGAVNVTDRYTTKAEELGEGLVPVRFCVRDKADSKRLVASVTVVDSAGAVVFEGKTRDERFDANDHLASALREGSIYSVEVLLGNERLSRKFTAKAQTLIDIAISGPQEQRLASGHITNQQLTRQVARTLRANLWQAHKKERRAARQAEFKSRMLRQGDFKMPFWYRVFGDRPEGGYSLIISMHGGGGAPKEVNDQQWSNQKKLYQIDNGIYLVPRAPTDTWNMWHQGHIDGFFDTLIKDMLLFEGINPDRVYLTGYSAGGDGAYQLAPRMADRFAAVAMMAGHPGETQPDGLFNLPFALHVGAQDAAYDRNRIGLEWQEKLGSLARENPGNYLHQVEVHTGKGHWMGGEDAVALPWMARHTRSLRPTRVVWLQDDVTHERYYWLRNREPKARERIVVERDGQVFTVLEAPPACVLEIRLDDSMCDLDQSILVRHGELVLFEGVVERRAETLAKTLTERGDPRGMFSAEIRVVMPAE